jgi:hypothetical protein
LDLFESHHNNLINLDVEEQLDNNGLLFEELKEPLAYNASSDEEEEHLLTEKLVDFALDNQVFAESTQQPLAAASSLFEVRYGSVPFGLPCIAQTRRTLDITLRNKQIEMINDKLCKVMRQPADYLKH